MKVEYSSNNSGGSWWLSDDDWYALERVGWEIDWYANQDSPYMRADKEGRWLGALASRATRYGLTLGEAIAEWERITGENSADLGCSCCGTPHSFTFEGDNGEHEYYTPDFPSSGSRYGEW